MSSGSDVVALVVASLVVVAPGGALLLALGVRRPLWWVALSPPASVGVATLTAMASAVLGVRFGPPALAVATALLTAVGLLRLRLRLDRRRRPDRPWGRCGDRVPGLVLVVAGVGLGVLVWTYGLGSMATVGQEHDLIVHGVLTAYIQQSGQGAPWQLMPADVLTGQGVMFYPAGLHLLMAVTATVTGSTAVGINAVSAVVLGAGWSSGSAALAYVAARRARLEAAPALVAAGMAAIVAAGLYRPTISLVQWGGTVPNAATLALTPGLLAALLSLPSTAAGWRSALRPAVAVGVAVAGMLAIHPSAVVTVGVSAVAWWGGEALTGDGRRRLLGQVLPLAAAGIVAAAVAAPMLLAMSRVAAHIGAFQPDIDPLGVGDALDRTLRMTYNVGDPRQKLAVAQWAAAGLALVGAAMSVAMRRALGAVVAWLAWVVIVVATWVRPGQGAPGLLTNVFYDAQLRVWSHASLFVPTLAGLAVALLAATLAPALVAHAPGRLTDPLARIPLRARPWPETRPGVALALAADPGTATGSDAPVPSPAEPNPALTRVLRPRLWPWAGRGRTAVVAHRATDATEASTVPPSVGQASAVVTPAGDASGQAGRRPAGWLVRWLPRRGRAAALAAPGPGPGEPGARGGRGGGVERRGGWVGVAVGGVLALGYLVGPGCRYSRTDVEALASRYARPEYTRVSASDQRAVDWLADQVAPGERVLNSANDGSTLLYVDRRVPIVNVASLGSAAEPATYRLLQGFNRYPDDPEVRRMLRDLDVRWVYVDSSAPTISASGAPEAWVAGNWLSVPQGFRHLAGLPGLERRFRSGTVSIYHLDPAVLG